MEVTGEWVFHAAMLNKLASWMIKRGDYEPENETLVDAIAERVGSDVDIERQGDGTIILRSVRYDADIDWLTETIPFCVSGSEMRLVSEYEDAYDDDKSLVITDSGLRTEVTYARNVESAEYDMRRAGDNDELIILTGISVYVLPANHYHRRSDLPIQFLPAAELIYDRGTFKSYRPALIRFSGELIEPPTWRNSPILKPYRTGHDYEYDDINEAYQVAVELAVTHVETLLSRLTDLRGQTLDADSVSHLRDKQGNHWDMPEM